jgi:hypothetical protein
MSTFKDTNFNKQNIPLLASEAAARGNLIKNVRYHLMMALPSNKPYFRGHFTTTFDLSSLDAQSFHIDFQGEQISNVEINGVQISDQIEF